MSEAPTTEMPAVDAVICTRNRPDKIGQAVASVLACDYPSFNLTVVDQSTDDATRAALEPLMENDPRLRYHHSDLPGLSRAYNTAVSITSADILAFTDDDCIAPSDWISRIAEAFADDPEADLLYGQVLPLVKSDDDLSLVPWLPIEQPERMGPGTRFRVFGMGANYAAQRRLFERIGPFDEILGGGGPLRSSQDFDMVYRTWRGGGVVVLRPEVAVRHDGRREAEDWPALLSAYGTGDGAFYFKHVRCRDPYAWWMFARHLVENFGTYFAKRILGRKPGKWPYLKGIFAGVRRSFEFDVDRQTRLYVERPKN